MAYTPTAVSSGNPDYIQAMQQASNPSSSAPNQVMGQEEFLMLLTTQLQNQDPSKPMDPTSFVTDLTQMSQLEASTRMNESIMAMTTSFQNMQTMQAASIIGKNVQVNGEDFSHSQGQVSQFRLNADEPLTDVTVVISDENGIVKEMEYGDLNPGEKVVDWDGLDDVGANRASGVYSLTAFGTNADGDVKSIDTIVASRVNAVGIDEQGQMKLTLATGERVEMNTVREISG